MVPIILMVQLLFPLFAEGMLNKIMTLKDTYVSVFEASVLFSTAKGNGEFADMPNEAL